MLLKYVRVDCRTCPAVLAVVHKLKRQTENVTQVLPLAESGCVRRLT